MATIKTHQNWYRTVWRWHFYAGLCCIPFILWLACTGMIYLFKPQIESMLDQPYDTITVSGTLETRSNQAQAALAAVPGSVLSAYVLPLTEHSAVRVLVKHGADMLRVYVHPQTLQILKIIKENDRLMRIIFQLHGELMLGDYGSMLVELVASWAIVMFITGLYLWWPRDAKNLAGILYPRLRSSKRVFWRDIHAVTALWISFFALFLLLSGLPWTKSWGGMLKELRQISASSPIKQDWTSGGGHAEHKVDHALTPVSIDYSALDRIAAVVAPLHLAPPVLISPPAKKSPLWTARSDSQNRPLRVTMMLDGTSGAIMQRKDFSQRPVIDRIIGTGVAAHEGQLFGWPNQLLGMLTALGLIVVSISAMIMWWKRKTPGKLGAPKQVERPQFAFGIIAIIIVLGVLLPLLGASLIFVTLCERFLLRRIPSARHFLGLGTGLS